MFWLKPLPGYSSSSLCFQGASGGPFTRPFGLGAAMHSSERRKTDVTLTVVQHIPARRGDLMTLLSLLTAACGPCDRAWPRAVPIDLHLGDSARAPTSFRSPCIGPSSATFRRRHCSSTSSSWDGTGRRSTTAPSRPRCSRRAGCRLLQDVVEVSAMNDVSSYSRSENYSDLARRPEVAHHGRVKGLDLRRKTMCSRRRSRGR